MALARRRARAWLYVARASGRTRTIPVTFAQRASVGSTEASNSRLARFGRIDRSVGWSPCALRSDRLTYPPARAVTRRLRFIANRSGERQEFGYPDPRVA